MTRPRMREGSVSDEIPITWEIDWLALQEADEPGNDTAWP